MKKKIVMNFLYYWLSWKCVYMYVAFKRIAFPSSKRNIFLLNSRLNDNRCLLCFITRANLTTRVIAAYDNHFISMLLPADTIPAGEEAMVVSCFLFYQSRFYSMIVALSVFPMVAEGYRRHPFILVAIRWCTERGGCSFLSYQPFYVLNFCTR